MFFFLLLELRVTSGFVRAFGFAIAFRFAFALCTFSAANA